MMRVIAGEYRGRTLRPPKGAATRPTTDRVRESLMSTIMSARGSWDGAVVLDAFAGSGALGIEALSRGAAYACFCEKDRLALQALESNTGFLERDAFRIARGDIAKRLPTCPRGAFDLVFLDPPYAMPVGDVAALIARIRDQGMLADGVLIAYEHEDSCDPVSHEAFLSLELKPISHKVYGSTVVDLFRKEPA